MYSSTGGWVSGYQLLLHAKVCRARCATRCAVSALRLACCIMVLLVHTGRSFEGVAFNGTTPRIVALNSCCAMGCLGRVTTAQVAKGNKFAFATGKAARQEERQLAQQFKWVVPCLWRWGFW
jgi:hypothetical protein